MNSEGALCGTVKGRCPHPGTICSGNQNPKNKEKTLKEKKTMGNFRDCVTVSLHFSLLETEIALFKLLGENYFPLNKFIVNKIE